jgi:hypothetical protein
MDNFDDCAHLEHFDHLNLQRMKSSFQFNGEPSKRFVPSLIGAAYSRMPSQSISFSRRKSMDLPEMIANRAADPLMPTQR